MTKKHTAIAMMAVLAGAASAASADTFQWDFTPGDPGSYGISNSGGIIGSVNATYSTDSQIMTWNVVFENQVTEGMTLAVNSGANPKGIAGELALLYIDGSADLGTPNVTAYGYNGQNNVNSYRDGDGITGGNQAPEKIMGLNERESWILGASFQDVGTQRILSLTLDMTAVNAHETAYPDPEGDPWRGAAFGESLGVWMHPFKQFEGTYGEDGFLTNLRTGNQGYLDGAFFETTRVPAPTTAMIGLLPLAGAARRRRS